MGADISRVDAAKQDDAARAAWLYYVAGNRQEEIAEKLGVSRQTAQRLVSLAVSEGLVKFRIDHPIGRCMELAAELRRRFALERCDVVPTDPAAPDLLTGVAGVAAAEIERVLKSDETRIVALGTGRALKASVEQVMRMSRPEHIVVSLLGNMMPDGAATAFNAAIRLADRVGARQYPFALPVLVEEPAELERLHRQEWARHTLELCGRADLTLVGIGQMDSAAPLMVDGFVSEAERAELVRAGAVGEITSWVYGHDGRLVSSDINRRVASAPLCAAPSRPLTGIALGRAKVPAIHGALTGRLVNGLITSEDTAVALLAKSS